MLILSTRTKALLSVADIGERVPTLDLRLCSHGRQVVPLVRRSSSGLGAQCSFSDTAVTGELYVSFCRP